METIPQFIAKARAARLEFLVIGGHAMIAYGSQRATFDFDLVVPDSQRAAWKACLTSVGYRLFFETDSFVQLESVDGGMPIDLMVVSQKTWAALEGEHTTRTLAGETLPLPAPLHLLGMKVHALGSRSAANRAKDWSDILELIKSCNLDVHSTPVRDIVVRYGGTAAYERLIADASGGS